MPFEVVEARSPHEAVGRELYVTNCGVCFDDGEVLRITE
jgi:hypothetical protein